MPSLGFWLVEENVSLKLITSTRNDTQDNI